MPLNWIRDLIISKVNSRNEHKIKNSNNLNNDPDLRITKLDKPINEMDAAERRIAAEKISEIMLNQANKYKKKNNKINISFFLQQKRFSLL